MIQFDEHIFQNGLVQPPTSFGFGEGSIFGRASWRNPAKYYLLGDYIHYQEPEESENGWKRLCWWIWHVHFLDCWARDRDDQVQLTCVCLLCYKQGWREILDSWDCNVWSFHSEDGTAPWLQAIVFWTLLHWVSLFTNEFFLNIPYHTVYTDVWCILCTWPTSICHTRPVDRLLIFHETALQLPMGHREIMIPPFRECWPS